jgi:hypothetical protein
LRPAEADGAEVARVGVDPVALDAEDAGDLRGIYVPHGRRRCGRDEVGDAAGDALDVVAVERAHYPPPPRPARISVSACWAQWVMRARAMRW